MKVLFLILLFCSAALFAFSQKDTLPNFTAKKKDGVITISWINSFKNPSQVNIQRSKDSNRNFITIHSSPSPTAKNYSYADKTAKNDSGYYRIFILFEGTNYIFTKAKRAFEDSVKTTGRQTNDKPDTDISATGPAGIKNKDNKNDIKIPPPVNTQPIKKAWEPSVYIFTGDDGNVEIDLPDAAQKKYSITFFREEGRPIFFIQQVKEPKLTLDKATFLKSGWYYFELKEEGKVKERNKFLITRDN
ncbi:MAG: hypothetical protein K2X48_10655 [Chitinophagaceae bacterium]|nr:hypothetical protein [Chitinophagaceae bacterium]